MLLKLIEYFVSNLVDKPELVSIKEIDIAGKKIIEIKVWPQDLSKVIGREGRTFRALHLLANSVEPDSNRDIVIDVVV